MFGGPAIGVAVFVVIAIGLGWGLIALFNAMLDQTTQDLTRSKLNHGFAAGGVYLTRKPMLIGYQSDGTVVLFPDQSDLPAGVPRRRAAPTVAGYRDDPASYPDLMGVVEGGTAVRIDEVIEDTVNAQSRVLIRLTILSGDFAEREAIGLHLEAATTDPQTGRPRYDPRPGLLVPARPADAPEPVQSPTPATDNAPTDAE